MSRKILLERKGFSLVEVVVVMAIISILFLLLAVGMLSGGKRVKLQETAKTLQTDIRQVANNSISVAPDMSDSTKSSKAWVIRIPDTSGGESAEYYIDDHTGDGESDISSKKVSLEYGITMAVTGEPDIVRLVFSTPFAEFKAIEEGIIWETNLETGIMTPDCSSTVCGVLFGNAQSIIIAVLTDPDGNKAYLDINVKTGETSVRYQ